MPPLNKALRSRLEKAAREARKIAELAAKKALNQLGVAKPVADSYLAEEQKALRKRLRAHGRQLGDSLNGSQNMERLIEETAYMHWQSMIFARFLAENNLLLYPDPDEPVAITLEECGELAAEEGRNVWELAASFAAIQLPQIFRPDSPLFAITLAAEDQKKLEDLVTGLPEEIFTASDSLGWVYQFWQADAKDRINKSEVKIGVRELPAVTQLFTEPYMVEFLLDNTLGAWWAAKTLSEEDWQKAESEDELRQKAALPCMPLTYLRFLRDDGHWRPAAGDFSAWPDTLADFRLLDPCCGSGHFLCAALRMLANMRMARECLEPKSALARVAEQNLHGLELDERCVQLAAFALAFAAWTFQSAGRKTGWFALPKLNIACSGLAPGGDKEKWTSLARPHTSLRNALDLLYDDFAKAPVLGSLIAPDESIARPDPGELETALRESLAREAPDAASLAETAVAARGIAAAAEILGHKYHLVITNVPYLARGKQADSLKNFCGSNYPASKNDIATVFLERGLKLCENGGACALVMPQNWLFLTSYKKLREKLLKKETWDMLARLGSGAFETISGEVVKAVLIVLSRLKPQKDNPLAGETARPHLLAGLDVSDMASAEAKAEALPKAGLEIGEQAAMLGNPDARVAFGEAGGELLEKYANSYQGVSPADFPRFGRNFWEDIPDEDWIFWQSTVADTQLFGGRSLTLWLSEVIKKATNEKTAYIRGEESWGKNSVVISAMRDLPATVGKGNPSDTNVAVLVPHNPSHLPAIWCFCSSPEYSEAVRQIDQSLKVTNATLVKVPFDLDRWQKAAQEKYPHGLPKPYSDDPTQWIFHGHPCGSVIWDNAVKSTANGHLRMDANVLQIAVGRLLGYRWPAEDYPDMELSEEQRQWVNACQGLDEFADNDGIVVISATPGEDRAAERLFRLLAAAYGDAWSNEVLNTLLAKAGHAGKSLESWLRDKFFGQHCQLFQNRPFVWQVWDGLPDGFSALLNYHKLDYRNLEKLIYTYLGDWINRQRNAVAAGVDGSREKLEAAENLKKRLEQILKGEKPHDIFVRWKKLEQQPIGWNPDLNDGVRLNIRPFMQGPDIGKKGAGILRDKPNIKWDKDRGRDVESSPWYGQFGGDRVNDWHLSLAEKEAARR